MNETSGDLSGLREGAKCAEEVVFDVVKQPLQKILLVRPSFRMGNSILATPFIFLFRRNFPNARIDFVGSPVAKALFKNLPIDKQYEITRRVPDSSWAYWALLRQIRAARYDLAMELSGSQSLIGSLIVGLSGSQYRVGLRGKQAGWYNVKLPKPSSRNKYEASSALSRSVGFSGGSVLPGIVLSPSEREEAVRKIASVLGASVAPDVGVFVGGRKRKKKRWPKENFLELIDGLHREGVRTIIFVGPEEQELVEFFRSGLRGQVPVIYEKSLIVFAAMVSACKLFVAGDSGPMHLGCAVGTRTVAIFQKDNVEHWAPPSNLARVVYEPGGTSPQGVLRACLLELVNLAETTATRL
jgi:heptosyltransferase-3